MIQKGFQLRTVDIVQDPSAPSAFVDGIMEGVEYFFDGHDYVAMAAEEERRQLSRMSVREIEETKAERFSTFLEHIRKDCINRL